MNQLPEEFTERMKKMLGEEYPDFLKDYQGIPHSALRLNPGKTTKEEFRRITDGMEDFMSLEEVAFEQNGFYYDRETCFPGKHPFHEAGVYYIQEPSAMAPVPFLQIKETDRVLDLCAAPGGKSTQIASYLGEKGFLLTNEIHPQRAKILSENIERMGIRNALVCNESPQKLSESFVEYFDKILVDAPCSGEGMFRKNENATEEWSMENVQLCAQRQKEILDCAAKMLRKGGRLVYSTCTFSPWENEETIVSFLQRNPDFVPVKISPKELLGGMEYGKDYLEILGENRDEAEKRKWEEWLFSMIRLWPHKVKGEGHFLAVLEKKGESSGEIHPEKGLAITGRVKDYKELEEFLKDTLTQDSFAVWEKERILSFGDHLYMVKEGFPSLKGLKVLRPGLHLGTRKKNRFEPSHALALALKSEEVRRVYELNLSQGECQSYLGGMTLNPGGETKPDKGWVLCTVCGFGIGFAKYAGGIMKNHYPKGLRK